MMKLFELVCNANNRQTSNNFILLAVQTRSVLKTYFETGDKPTAAQFGNLIDSALMANFVQKTDTTSINVVAKHNLLVHCKWHNCSLPEQYHCR